MSENDVKVRVSHMTKKFGDLLVLNDISFNVNKGEFLCVVGPTGCGKTTFLNCITKLQSYELTSGEILINDEPVNLHKHNVAYIFQEYSSFPWYTVEENIAYGLKVKKRPKTEIKASVEEMLDLVKLRDYRNYYPHQLSASMLQRVAIARAFAVKPELLLMDEPYGQLDNKLRYKLEDELIKLWKFTDTTVIFITHNIEEATYLSERLLVLTNKPTTIKKDIKNNLPYPRCITDLEFNKLRDEVTELIKWW